MAILVSAGCTVNEIIYAESTILDTASLQISEHMLLDIGVVNFDPGIPENNDVEKTRIHPEIREAESKYIPYHIKVALQQTGFWGAVRVIPSDYAMTDVLISGVIEESNGEYFTMHVNVKDITGAHWFEQSYSTQTGLASYAEYRDKSQDPYQKAFNDFANDLHAYVITLTPEEINNIRQISELKFFEDMSPAAFNGYLATNEEGHTIIARLPAHNDPMINRLQQIRERDRLVIDTLNEHYANYYYGIAIPYEGWRKVSQQENINYRQVKKSGLQQILLGMVVVLGSVEVGSGGRGYARRSASHVGIDRGFKTIMAGWTRRKEAKMHLLALQELSESFVAEAAPMTIMVEGESRRITGTAAAQYEGWRQLLREIYKAETGLSEPVNISTPTRN